MAKALYESVEDAREGKIAGATPEPHRGVGEVLKSVNVAAPTQDRIDLSRKLVDKWTKSVVISEGGSSVKLAREKGIDAAELFDDEAEFLERFPGFRSED